MRHAIIKFPLQPLGGFVVQQLPWNAPPLPANLPTQSLLKFDQPDGQHRYQFPDPPFDRTQASQLATRRSAARSRCSMRARVREMNAEDRLRYSYGPARRENMGRGSGTSAASVLREEG